MFSTKEEYDKLLEAAKQYPKNNLLYDGSCAHFSGQMTQFVLSMAPYLEEFYRVFLSKPTEKPDLIWVASDKFNEKLLDHNVPIIIEDVYQPPDVLGETRKIINHKSVKLLLKNSSAIKHGTYNQELSNHSIHQTIIARTAPEYIQQKTGAITPLMTDTNFRKITAAWNYITWPNFRHGFAQDHRSLRDYYQDLPIPRYPELYDVPSTGSFINSDRPYDVNFIGNIVNWHESVPLIRYHRKLAWEAILRCPGTKIIKPTNSLGWHEYWKVLRQSKIVISPWGWEPVTIRDIEAILAGCILIKPDTSFAATYPNIPYFRCKPDFSDLEDQVTMVLDRWDTLEDYRRQTYQQLHDISDNMPKRVYSMIAKAIDHHH